MNDPNRKVIAFLGAGLTRKFGYGDWKELILGGGTNTSPLTNICLKDWAGFQEEDFEEFRIGLDEYDLPAAAQKCYDKVCEMGGIEKWEQFLEKKFGNIDSIWVDVNEDPISNIFYSKYFCFVTTNFDGVLKKYGEKCINNITIQVFPKNLYKPFEKNLVYLHGAGFKIIENYSPNIILTKESYLNAYMAKSQMDDFLPELLRYDIVFIGFSMNDSFISEFLRQQESLRKETIKNNPEINPNIFMRKRFLILPSQPQTIKETKLEKRTEESLIKEEDEKLKSQNLVVIRYNKESNDPHQNFPNLMRKIFQDAPNKNLLAKAYDISKAWS